MNRLNDFIKFIVKRHNIYQRRLAGQPKPWTKDPILQRYRFCNVYREYDTVTKWIAKHWRDPHSTDPDVWFAMAVARFINWPDTLNDLGYPVPFNPKWIKEQLQKRTNLDLKVFTGAYMIKSVEGVDKISYITEYVLSNLWQRQRSIQLKSGKVTCAGLYKELIGSYGVGSFMAGQIVADTKYTYYMVGAEDWFTWACSGPGSHRGLNRLLNRPLNAASLNETTWLANVQEIREQVNPSMEREGFPLLHAQDVQNCLCEFDKYERVRLGQGRPRSLYPGGS